MKFLSACGKHLFLCACVCSFACACQVDEVMLTLKQAFSTAAALQSNKTQIQLCEACPMHDLHKLCERIEGRSCHLHQTSGTSLGFDSWIYWCFSELKQVKEYSLFHLLCFQVSTHLEQSYPSRNISPSWPTMSKLRFLSEFRSGNTGDTLIQTCYFLQLLIHTWVFVHSFLQRLKPASDQEENELVILHLRQLCETKQKSHLHIGEAPKVRARESSRSRNNFQQSGVSVE